VVTGADDEQIGRSPASDLVKCLHRRRVVDAERLGFGPIALALARKDVQAPGALVLDQGRAAAGRPLGSP
jgi:hypothetical protein